MSSHTITATGAGTWATPAGSTALVITCYGGGGAGGPSDSTKGGYAGSGGGGGECSIKTVASPSGTYNYSVGTGGATSGLAGGDTWFISNDSAGCVAKGGSGGTAGGATGGGGTGGFGDTKYAGGDGFQGGSNTFGGGGGEGAASNAAGTDATGQAGATGTAGGDGGAGGAVHTGGSAAPSTGYGGGGGGGGHTNTGGSPTAGGAGRQGWIYLTWTGPTSADTSKRGLSDATALTLRHSSADTGRVGQTEGVQGSGAPKPADTLAQALTDLPALAGILTAPAETLARPLTDEAVVAVVLAAGADTAALGLTETAALLAVVQAITDELTLGLTDAGTAVPSEEGVTQVSRDEVEALIALEAHLLTALIAGGDDVGFSALTDGGPGGGTAPLIGLSAAE